MDVRQKSSLVLAGREPIFTDSGVGPYYLTPDYHKRLQYDAIKSVRFDDEKW